MHLVDLPEFGYAPLPALAPFNPVHQPTTACSPDEYFSNVTLSCHARPVQQLLDFTTEFERVTAVASAWRGLPEVTMRQLLASNCTPTDIPCLFRYVESQFNSSNFLTLLETLAADASAEGLDDAMDGFLSGIYGV